MSYKPDENTLLAYLYGELDKAESEKVEDYVKNNPWAKKKLEEMKALRQLLSTLPDKEVVPPIILEAKPDKNNTAWIKHIFKYAAGIALVLAFAAVMGKVLSVEIQIGDSELKIGFGGTKSDDRTATEEKLTLLEINQLIEKSIADYYKQVNEKPSAMDIEKSFQEYSKTMDLKVSEIEKNYQQGLNTYLEKMQQENLRLIEVYLQNSSLEQKQNMEAFITDLVGAIQEVREQDFIYMQTRLNSIETDKERFKLETERILASLLINSANY